MLHNYNLSATILKIDSQVGEDLFCDDCEKCKSIEIQGQPLDGDFGDTQSLIFVIPLSCAELGNHSLRFFELIDLSPRQGFIRLRLSELRSGLGASSGISS